MTAAEMIDWDLAISVGSRLAGSGPEVSRGEAESVVAELREGAARSTGLVREYTGLLAADATAPLLVVDRPGWIRANAASFDVLLTPFVDKVTEKKGAPTGISKALGSRVTGAEIGAVLGFLGGKVLGQFDPFYSPHEIARLPRSAPPPHDSAGTPSPVAGRLLLVAPNIVHVERELQADPHDFRLWVCLHEETHRVQFTAVPWMRDHLAQQVDRLSESIEPTRLLDDGLKRLAESLKGGAKGSLIDILGTPEQREIMDHLTGVMSLLEGHADVVMDGVGPGVIASVKDIRKKFTQRRKGVGVLDRLLRKVLGLDAKMAQYRDGARFVRGVVDKVGMADFNVVWQDPAHLPTKAEIADPAAWVTRVL
jgi:coenzyme F420 biosynthesis associated uncharacterized protein